MAHHLDSPLARQDPRLDISDVFLFRGSTGTVFVMDVNPVSGTGGFHPEGMYEFKIDTDGDAVEDITFRVTFGPADAEGSQQVELRRLDGSAAADRHAPGTLLAEGRTEQEVVGPDGLRLWAGAAADPFYIEGTVVTAVKTAVATGTPVELDGFDPAAAANAFGGRTSARSSLKYPTTPSPTRASVSGESAFWPPTPVAGARSIVAPSL